MDDKRVIKTIKRTMPAVVSIAIAKRLEDLEKEMPKEHYPFPANIADSRGMVQVGGGTGFIVESNGLILTNKHVVNEHGAEYTVILNDGRAFPAVVLSRDPINDVAIIKIEATGLPCLKLGDAHSLELGQTIIAIGNALGIFKNTVSLGIVSGLSRSISAKDGDGPDEELRGLIQTDAAINPGNSGGPLIDLDGRVVGVNAAIVSGAQSIGFAIPVNAAERDLMDIKRYGRIKRPLLGVRYVMVDNDLKEKMRLPVDYGAIVTRESAEDYAIVPESPADKAGVKEKDIILALNDHKLDREHPIQDFLETLNVGDEIALKILRGKEELTIKMTLAERK